MNARAKSHDEEKRVSPLPLNEFLALKIHESGKKNVDIAREVGYLDAKGHPKGNVIAMLKSQMMDLPINKVVPMAKSLDVDPVLLMRKKLEESVPGLWAEIQGVLGDQLISQHERELIRLLQSMTKEIDPAYCADPEFISELRGSVTRLLERQIARHREAMARLSKVSEKA